MAGVVERSEQDLLGPQVLIGGPALEGFSIALLVGILVGTYSSIYIASATALDAGLTAESLFPPRKKLAIDDLP